MANKNIRAVVASVLAALAIAATSCAPQPGGGVTTVGVGGLTTVKTMQVEGVWCVIFDGIDGKGGIVCDFANAAGKNKGE